MNGNITKEGIRADLEWMKRANIGGFQNFDAALSTPQVVKKRLIYMTPELAALPAMLQYLLIKLLVTDNKDKDFRFISIETWGSDIEGLKRYHKNNELNYTLLKGEEETTKNYHVNGVPSFFILDKNRIIRKVILGYEEGTTDKEIRDAINNLI